MMKKVNRWLALLMAVTMIISSAVYTSGIATVSDSALKAAEEQLSADSTDSIDAGTVTNQTTEPVVETPVVEESVVEEQPVPVQNVEIQQPAAEEPSAVEPRAAEPQAVEPQAAEPQAAEPQAAEVTYTVTLQAPNVAGGTISTWVEGGERKDSTSGSTEEITERALYFVEVTASENYEVDSLSDQNGNEIVARSVNGNVYTYEIQVTANMELKVNYKEVEVKEEKKEESKEPVNEENKKEENKEPSVSSNMERQQTSEADKIRLTVKNLAAVYNGREQYLPAATAVHEEATTTQYLQIEYSRTGKEGEWSSQLPGIKDVKDGLVTVYVRAYVTHLPSEFKTAKATMQILPKKLTVKGDALTYIYSELHEPPAASGKVDGIAKGDSLESVLKGNITYTYDREINSREEGTYVITPNINDVEVINPNYEKVLGVENGSLKVMKSAGKIELDAEGYSDYYDGAEHSFTIVQVRIVEGEEEIILKKYENGEWTGTGTDSVRITYQVYNDKGELIGEPSEEFPTFTDAGEYKVRIVAEVPGYVASSDEDVLSKDEDIVIKKRFLAYSVDSAWKYFAEDDPEFVAKEVAIPDGGLIPADKAIVKPIVSREGGDEAVGDYSKVLKVSDINWGDVNPENYKFTDIHEYRGDFTIKPSDALGFEVGEDIAPTYDGKSYSPKATATINGVKVEEATIKYSINKGKDWHDSLSLTDAGTYEVYVKVEKEGYTTKQSNPENPNTIQIIDIKKKDLTVTADAETIQFKDRGNLPSFTYKYEGNVKGETPGFSGEPALEKEIKSVGKYDIVQGALKLKNTETFKAGNYNLKFEPGTLTVNGTIEVKATELKAVYNGSEQTLEPATATASEEGAEIVIQYSFNPEGAWSNTPVGRKDVTNGEVPVYVRASIKDETKKGFYSEAKAKTTIEITPATLTVTPKDVSKAYGEEVPDLTGKISGYKGEDTYLVVEGEPAYSTTAEQFSPVKDGGYPITVDVSDLKSVNGNYEFAAEKGKLTVTRADTAKKITSNVAERYKAQYDGEQHTLADFKITGAGGETLVAWDAKEKKMALSDGTTVRYGMDFHNGGIVYSDDMPSFTHVSQSRKVYIEVTNPNYDAIKLIETFMEITQRPVIIQVLNESKIYGQDDPEFTYKIASELGFLEKDNIRVQCNRGESGEDVKYGEDFYKIVAQAAGDKVDNYAIEFEEGEFRILPPNTVELEVTSYSGTYDGKEHGVKVKVADGIQVVYSTDEGKTWSEDPVTRTDYGGTKLWVKACAPNSSYVDNIYKDASITITPATIEVSADDQTISFEDKENLELTYSKPEKGVNGEIPKFEGELALVDGDKKVTDFKEITKIGKYTIDQHTLKLADNGSFKADNYELKYTGAVADITGELTLNAEDYTGTYDGLSHTATVQASTSDNTPVKVEYSYDKISWTEQEFTFTDVTLGGNNTPTRTFFVRASADGYPGQEKTVSVTISPAIVEVTPESFEVAFTDEDKAVKLTEMNKVASISIKKSIYDSEEHEIKNDDKLSYTGYFEKASGDSVGKYGITQGTFALDQDSTDFNDENYFLQVKEGATVTITGELYLSLENYVGTYDSEGHGITVEEARADDPSEKTSVEYSLDKDKWSTDPIEITDATNGPVTVYARITAPGNENYEAVEKEATINISKKEITIKADDKNVVYGEDIPELTASIDETGLADNDSAADVLTNDGGLAAGIYTTTAAAGSPAGNYDIIAEAGGLTSKNYDLKFAEGTLSITQAAGLLLTVEDRTFTYDGNDHTVGVAHGDAENTTVEYSLDNGATWSTEVPRFTDAGTYDVLVKATSPNYSDTPEVKGTITINPKDVTILVANATKTFGTEDPIFTGEVTGLVAADDLGNVVYGRADEDAAKENVEDDITITAAYTANKNYNVQVIPAKLAITSAGQLDAEVTDVEVVYGGTPNGLLVSVTPGATPMYSTDGQNWSEIAPTYTEAGVYEVYVKAVRDGYTESEAKLGTITINAREIEITAASAEKAYDGAELTATSARISSGTLAEGEEVTSVTVRGSQTMVGSSANVASDVVIMKGDVNVTSNYAVGYVDGTLTVNEAAVIVTPEAPTPAPTPTPTAVTPPAAAAAAGVPTVIAPPATTPAAPAADVNAPTAVEETAAEYDLTEVADTETPLANTNLDEHDCCVLHFILMLALLLLSVFATASLKKNQKRLFELRKEYELAACKRGLSKDDGKSKRIA